MTARRWCIDCGSKTKKLVRVDWRPNCKQDMCADCINKTFAYLREYQDKLERIRDHIDLNRLTP